MPDTNIYKQMGGGTNLRSFLFFLAPVFRVLAIKVLHLSIPSQWSRGLGRESAAARFLGLRIHIKLGT